VIINTRVVRIAVRPTGEEKTITRKERTGGEKWTSRRKEDVNFGNIGRENLVNRSVNNL